MFQKVVLLAGAVLLVAGCSSSSRYDDRIRTVTCESRNGTFSDCERVGSSNVTLARQLSDSSCVEGLSWGVRNGSLWVDRGCRAEFTVGGRGVIRTAGGIGSTLVCESVDGRLRQCPVNTTGGVQLIRQLSSTACTFDRTWGWDARGIWVNEGCRAEFAVGGGQTMASRNAIVCESVNNRRNHCPAETRFGVDLVRQLSDSACVRNRTWGEDARGIWVTEGCRAEFSVRTQ